MIGVISYRLFTPVSVAFCLRCASYDTQNRSVSDNVMCVAPRGTSNLINSNAGKVSTGT